MINHKEIEDLVYKMFIKAEEITGIEHNTISKIFSKQLLALPISKTGTLRS